ncbi:DMT family transporter [Candidatus Finniella inopinata]|nr:DMT family transporter [Candidatus Finniella inopinata]
MTASNKSNLNLTPFYGAGLIVLVAVLTTISNGLTHSLPKTLSSSQILFFKSCIGFLLVVAWHRTTLKQLLTTQNLKWQFLKGFAGAAGNGFWIAAVQVLPLADSSALSLTSALMTTAGAYYFFSENPTRPLLWAIGVGFVGVLVILKPSSAIFNVYSLYPLLSAFAFTASSLIIKKVAVKDSSQTTLCYLLFFMALCSFLPAIYYWQPVEMNAVLRLAGIAVLYLLGQLALIEAYTYTQAAFLAPFKFARFPLAIASGWLFFGEHFSWSTLAGGGLIIASYFYLGAVTHRLRKVKPLN